MQKRIFLAFLALFPLVSFADIHPVITLSSGLANTNVYSSRVIMFGSYPNAYIGSNHRDSEIDSGVFLGGEMALMQDWAWQLGLSYFQNSAFTASGDVNQFADPAFHTLNYQYQIQTHRFSLETKISHLYREVWHPYLAASVGEAFNKAYGYSESPVSSADSPMTQPFGNHSSKSLTYSAGFGFDVNVSKNIRLGLGYRFADFGHASLSVTPLQTGTNRISNAHLYTNEFLAQISYLG